VLDIICLGSATLDVFVRTDLSKLITLSDATTEQKLLCFEYGSKVNVDQIVFQVGGGAVNTSVSFARLGFRVGFLGKLGCDEAGNRVVGELGREGVDCRLAVRSAEHKTGYSVVLTSFEGGRTILTFRGANNELRDDEVDWDALRQSRWLYISSLSGNSSRILDRVADFAQTQGISVAINPGATQVKRGVEGLRRILGTVEVLLMNAEEACALTGIKKTRQTIIEDRCSVCEVCVDVCPEKLFSVLDGRIIVRDQERCTLCGLCVKSCPSRAITIEPWADDLAPVLRTLRDLGPRVVVVTDGRKGAQAFDGKNRYFMPPFKVRVASTLGAGDAFGSTFVAGMVRHGDVCRALQMGAANSASVVGSYGGTEGLLNATEVERFIQDHTHDGACVRVAGIEEVMA
jgi:ribokinase